MDLSQLKPPAGQTRNKKRIGRGMGSGHGKTSGRGMKGQHAISGFSQKRGFEGGQMPLHRRMPKRGFNNIFRKEYAVLNVSRLNDLPGDSFSPEIIEQTAVLKNLKDGLKILGNGEITRPIHVKAHAFTEQAAAKIKAAGGTVEVIEVVVAPIKRAKKTPRA
ncbi:MAG: 50S ribosomal protein L15 [Bryobacterales bacterium]|jgi:large subunit ribosomal protein L15|nr:50S ribosomal protein L15 [Bryobacterales bacterium]